MPGMEGFGIRMEHINANQFSNLFIHGCVIGLAIEAGSSNIFYGPGEIGGLTGIKLGTSPFNTSDYVIHNVFYGMYLEKGGVTGGTGINFTGHATFDNHFYNAQVFAYTYPVNYTDRNAGGYVGDGWDDTNTVSGGYKTEFYGTVVMAAGGTTCQLTCYLSDVPREIIFTPLTNQTTITIYVDHITYESAADLVRVYLKSTSTLVYNIPISYYMTCANAGGTSPLLPYITVT